MNIINSMKREENKVDRGPGKIQSIIRILVKVYKRFEKIWPKAEILIVYMFIGLSIGGANKGIQQYSKIILVLIYFGAFTTIQMLSIYCKKNELKTFGKMNLSLFGVIIFIISYAIIIFPY